MMPRPQRRHITPSSLATLHPHFAEGVAHVQHSGDDPEGALVGDLVQADAVPAAAVAGFVSNRTLTTFLAAAHGSTPHHVLTRRAVARREHATKTGQRSGKSHALTARRLDPPGRLSKPREKCAPLQHLCGDVCSAHGLDRVAEPAVASDVGKQRLPPLVLQRFGVCKRPAASRMCRSQGPVELHGGSGLAFPRRQSDLHGSLGTPWMAVRRRHAMRMGTHILAMAASSPASQKAAAYTMGPSTGPLPASSAAGGTVSDQSRWKAWQITCCACAVRGGAVCRRNEGKQTGRPHLCPECKQKTLLPALTEVWYLGLDAEAVPVQLPSSQLGVGQCLRM